MGNEIFFNHFIEAYIIINSVNFLIKFFFKLSKWILNSVLNCILKEKFYKCVKLTAPFLDFKSFTTEDTTFFTHLKGNEAEETMRLVLGNF